MKVEIKDGVASSNVPEPYFIKNQNNLKSSQSSRQYENAITLDTQNKFDIERFASYNTAIILNKDSLTAVKDSGFQVYPLKDFPNFVLDKNTLIFWSDRLVSLLKFVYPFIPLLLFVVGYCMIASYFIYLLFGALAIWVTLKFKKINIGYWKSYQLGLHLMTPVIVLVMIINFLGGKFVFLTTILLIIFTAINVKNVAQNITQNNVQP